MPYSLAAEEEKREKAEEAKQAKQAKKAKKTAKSANASDDKGAQKTGEIQTTEHADGGLQADEQPARAESAQAKDAEEPQKEQSQSQQQQQQSLKAVQSTEEALKQAASDQLPAAAAAAATTVMAESHSEGDKEPSAAAEDDWDAAMAAEEEGNQWLYSCIMCGDGGDVVMCEACPRVYHIDCLGQTKVGRGGWCVTQTHGFSVVQDAAPAPLKKRLVSCAPGTARCVCKLRARKRARSNAQASMHPPCKARWKRSRSSA